MGFKEPSELLLVSALFGALCLLMMPVVKVFALDRTLIIIVPAVILGLWFGAVKVMGWRDGRK